MCILPWKLNQRASNHVREEETPGWDMKLNRSYPGKKMDIPDDSFVKGVQEVGTG